MPEQLVAGWEAASTATGKSIASLRRLHARGKLPSAVDEAGRHTFTKADLAAVVGRSGPADGAEARAGLIGGAAANLPVPGAERASPALDDLEAEVYTLLARRVPPAEICLHVGAQPEWVRRRALAWHRLEGASAPADRVEELERQVAGVAERLAACEAQLASHRVQLRAHDASIGLAHMFIRRTLRQLVEVAGSCFRCSAALRR